MTSPKDLKGYRAKIDQLDKKIVELLSERALASQEIGKIKGKKNRGMYSPDREMKVYNKVSGSNKGPLPDSSMKAIYREIMSACLALEKPTKVAFFGPEFTFTHTASLRKFGSSVDYMPCDSISEVFSEVEKENANYGVVPIENSTEGAVNHTMDMMVDSPLVICSEIYSRIVHNLLSKSKSIEEIEVVYSHPQVFGQCRRWLEKNLPKADLKESSSTSRAAELAASEKNAASISTSMAAEKFGLNVISESIQDRSINITRFLVIGTDPSRSSGHDKTSIVFSVKDRPGVLHDMLLPFKNENINLTKIESRPSKKGLWKYYFFIDLEGHSSNDKVKKVLNDLENKCQFLKLLGSYPITEEELL